MLCLNSSLHSLTDFFFFFFFLLTMVVSGCLAWIHFSNSHINYSQANVFTFVVIATFQLLCPPAISKITRSVKTGNLEFFNWTLHLIYVKGGRLFSFRWPCLAISHLVRFLLLLSYCSFCHLVRPTVNYINNANNDNSLSQISRQKFLKNFLFLFVCFFFFLSMGRV